MKTEEQIRKRLVDTQLELKDEDLEEKWEEIEAEIDVLKWILGG